MTVQQTVLENGLYLVSVTGRLDQKLSPILTQALALAINDGHSKIVVDLSAVSYINSGGLRSLVTAWRKARGRDGDLTLCGLNDRLRDVFAMVGFDKVFAIYPSQDVACARMLANE